MSIFDHVAGCPKIMKKPTAKKKKPKPITADDLSAYGLKDAITFAEAYGNITKVADTMTAISGESVTRQMVGRWLNGDPAKRQQPSFGTAILLLIAVDIVRGNTDPSATFLTIEVPEIPQPKRK